MQTGKVIQYPNQDAEKIKCFYCRAKLETGQEMIERKGIHYHKKCYIDLITALACV